MITYKKVTGFLFFEMKKCRKYSTKHSSIKRDKIICLLDADFYLMFLCGCLRI